MSDGKTETDRERAAFAALIAERAKAEETIDPEEIWKAVAGDLPPQETGRLLDRAGESAAFAEAWRVAREVQAMANESESAAAAEQRQGPGRVAIWAGIAAALLLAVGLWPVFLGERDAAPRPPVYRAAESLGLESQIDEGIALPREHLLLRWSPAPGEGWRYEVRITTDDLEEIVLARDLVESRYLVPPELLETQESGSRLFWRVEASHEDGRTMSSPTFIANLQ